jgi:hypothetical protein
MQSRLARATGATPAGGGAAAPRRAPREMARRSSARAGGGARAAAPASPLPVAAAAADDERGPSTSGGAAAPAPAPALSGRIARFRATKQVAQLVRELEARSLAEYMALPASQYSVLDARKVCLVHVHA